MENRDAKILFLDESMSQKYKFTIVSGFFIPQNKLMYLEENILKIIEEFGLVNLEDVHKSKIQLSAERLCEFHNKLSKILLECNVKILSSIIYDKEICFYKKKYYTGTYVEAVSLILERFSYNISSKEYGIVYYDDDSHKKYLIKIGKEQIITYNSQKYLSNLYSFINKESIKKKIPIISLLDNKYSLAIQVADIISFILKSTFDSLIKQSNEKNYLINIKYFDAYYEYLPLYWDLIVKSSKENVFGFGIKVWGNYRDLFNKKRNNFVFDW